MVDWEGNTSELNYMMSILLSYVDLYPKMITSADTIKVDSKIIYDMMV